MDVYSTEDMYEGFRRYQTSLLEQFDRLAEEYSFKVVDATPEPKKIFEKLRAGITKILEGEPARPALEVTSGGTSPPVAPSTPAGEPEERAASAAIGASPAQGENLKA